MGTALVAVLLTAIVIGIAPVVVRAMRTDPWKCAISMAVVLVASSQRSQLFPVDEFVLAREVGSLFVGAEFDEKASRLALITIHTQ